MWDVCCFDVVLEKDVGPAELGLPNPTLVLTSSPAVSKPKSPNTMESQKV